VEGVAEIKGKQMNDEPFVLSNDCPEPKRRAENDIENYSVKVVSFGGGVNSTALLIGMREQNMRPDAILFADTGGEKPETYAHVDRMRQWCIDAGFPPMETVTYYQSKHASLEVECLNNGTLPSKAFGFAGCSVKWKRAPMDRHLKTWQPAVDAWANNEQVCRLIGIHAGEMRRGQIPDDVRFVYRYPLIYWDWTQVQCEEACRRELGYAPVKSACFFCPAMRKVEVIQLSKQHPELFARAVELEHNAEECDGLTVVKGLGRHWSWEGLVAADEAQQRLLTDCQHPRCDVCIDW
jgi:hypothetical protein